MRPPRCPRSAPIVAALALGAVAAGPARAAYDFVVLADSAGPAPPRLLPPSIDEDGAVAFIALVPGMQHILVARDPGATALEHYELLGSGSSYNTLGEFGFGRASYTAPTPGTAGASSSIHRTDGAQPLYTGVSSDVDRVGPPLNVLGQTVVLETVPAGRVVLTDGEETQVVAERFQDFGDGSTEYGLVSFPRPTSTASAGSRTRVISRASTSKTRPSRAAARSCSRG
jgi:hypothetical protein